MPIAKMPTNPPPSTPEQRIMPNRITAPQYRHSLVDSQEPKLTALISNITGASWIVDYYGQLVGADEALSSYEPGQQLPYLQYSLIRKYELKLQGALNIGVDETTTEMTATGTAHMYPFVLPNVGDVILGYIGDGYVGQFTVTKVQKLTMFKETAYEIDFELSKYVDQALIDNLNSFVVRSSTFVKDFLTYGQNPVMADDDLLALDTMKQVASSLLAEWLSTSSSYEERTILVGGQAVTLYDPYLVPAVLRVFEIDAHPMLHRLRLLNCDDFEMMHYIPIWTALINRDPGLVRQAFTKVQLVSSQRFNKSRYMDGVHWSGVGYVVTPQNVAPQIDSGLSGHTTPSGNSYTLTPVPLTPPVPPVSYPAVGTDGDYVFSAAFYASGVEPSPALTALENFVIEYLKGGAINHATLLGFTSECINWPPLERFYLIPVLLIILRTEIRNL